MRGQIRKRISYRFASFRIHRPEQNMKMRSKPEPEPGPGPVVGIVHARVHVYTYLSYVFIV